MIKKAILLLAAVLLTAACTQEILSPTGKVLGEVTVESDAGEIPVLVSADGVWKAESASGWISVDGSWHSGAYSLLLRYASNQSVEGLHRSARKGYVLIETADGAQTDTLVINQKGFQP